MAIQREIRIAFRPRADRTVRLAGASEFPPREFALEPGIAPYPAGDWGNYAKAAASALIALYPDLHGMDALVMGDIPAAAGLSSSSALVVGSALALLEANAQPWHPGELASEMARAERFVGTQGGGMDQTVCLCAQPHAALKIDFTPFRYTPVTMPLNWTFVVGNSLVVADKSLGARERYNATHGRSSAALEAMGMGASYPELLAAHSASELVALAETRIPASPRGAFRHMVTEAARVEEAEAAMRAGDMAAFGRAMNASHESMAHDLRISCPEVNEMVAAFRAGGATGARLTGAGFGGCAVALCDRSQAPAMIDAVRQAYYAPRGVDPAPYLFEVNPCAGAGRTA